MDQSKENNVQNGEEDEDDDFEDFGGFEAADPVLPNVAQSASGLPTGVQATPNPWAVFPSGNVSVQPDLLCGQNRFPAHLDTPTTVDVASGAVASVENGEPGIAGSMDRANGMFDMEQDLNNDIEPELDLDQINLANDILDGSFRTNQSGAAFVPHGREQLPDISAFDLGISFENRNVNNSEVVNRTEADQLQGSYARLSGALDNQSDLNLTGAAAGVNTGLSANENEARSPRAAVGGDLHVESANEQSENRSCDEHKVADSAEANNLRTLLEQAELEKLTAQQELTEQLAVNTKLEEDLQRAKELAESAQAQYDKLQEEHNKQLDDLRQAGHQTLTVVVEEYKELLKTTVLQQQEVWNRQLKERLKEESERFTTVLEEQSEKFKTLQREERQKNEDRVKEVVEEMKDKQQAQFEKELSEERKKTEERLNEAVQKERDKSQQEIERVIEEERRKAQQLLEAEQVKLKAQLSEEVSKTQEEFKEALNKERQDSKDELEKLLDEERKQSRETSQQCMAATRDEMKEYLQEQRKRDKALQQRQFATLDLFLESARQQLKLLMDKNPSDVEEKENS